MRIRISGGRVVDPLSGRDGVGDVYIAQGRIAAVGRAPSGFEAHQTIDARGKVVCPGFVDIGVRLREPGEEHKATIGSETRAAARAGITTLGCLPDTDPVIDTPAVAELIYQRAEAAGYARVVCLGALTKGLTGETLAEMNALREVGCVGLSNAQHPIRDTGVLRHAFEYAASCDMTVFIYPEDPWLAMHGHMHEGFFSSRLGLPSVPETAETIGLSRDLLLIEQTGVRAHFCRISTARGARMIAEARKRKLPISADVGVYYLHMADEDVGYFDSMFHVRPPFRTRRDRVALRRAVTRGDINVIASDHQPQDHDAKNAPFSDTLPGISALDTLLPLSLQLVSSGTLRLSDAIAALSATPASILGLEGGQLAAGAVADICVFDPDAVWQLSANSIWSAGKNTPLIGREMRGQVTHTLVGGKLVYKAR